MKRDIEKFRALGSEVLGILVDKEDTGQKFDTTVIKGAYPLLLDPSKSVVTSLGQDVKILKLGRMPGLLVIGQDRKVVYAHYGRDMKDIPPNDMIFPIIEQYNAP